MGICFRSGRDKIYLLGKEILGKQRDMGKGLFCCLRDNKKIITEHVKIQEEGTGNKA